MLTKFPFDPLGLDSEANREKEVKNGRLAMVSVWAGTGGASACCSCIEHITLLYVGSHSSPGAARQGVMRRASAQGTA